VEVAEKAEAKFLKRKKSMNIHVLVRLSKSKPRRTAG